MRTIVIFKTATPDERIVLRTDSMYDDYESVFTVMTVEGSIGGVINEFRGGSIISLSTISRFVANNTAIELTSDTPKEIQGIEGYNYTWELFSPYTWTSGAPAAFVCTEDKTIALAITFTAA